MKIRYFSMFSGIGGFELGMPAEWECVGYSEIDKYAIQIYQKHFSNHINYGDATKIDPRRLPDFDLLVGGFPCQAFSIAGSRKGFDDVRGTLFFDIARIIKEKRPEYLLLENVKGLLSHDGGRTYKTILSTLAELDYDTEAMVFDSFYFNATTRKRIFMLAHDRFKGVNARQGIGERPSLYSCFSEGIRNTRPENSAEIGGVSAAIIRASAKLPDWLDGWDSIYGEKKSGGQCRDGQCDQGDH